MILKIGIIVLSYLIGSLSFGIILSKLLKKKDVRDKDFPGGAGSIRQFGFSFGALVGLLDILKGTVVVYIALNYGKSDIVLLLSILAVIAGHSWPVYFGFKGGQGLATTIGVFITLFPLEALLSFLIGGGFSLLFKFLKLGRYIKFVGAIPFGAVFGLISLFLIIFKKYGFYPYSLIIISVVLLLIIRGLEISIFSKRRVM
ncbi:MAG: hypothetical protein DRI28_02345 [Caldiserica bacterium]|nr:MAG: hypothetical protein DRI28_02345 [Caldisericota bacterium]